MATVIGYGFMAGVLFLTVRSIVRGVRRGRAEGWNLRAPWVRRLHDELRYPDRAMGTGHPRRATHTFLGT